MAVCRVVSGWLAWWSVSSGGCLQAYFRMGHKKRYWDGLSTDILQDQCFISSRLKSWFDSLTVCVVFSDITHNFLILSHTNVNMSLPYEYLWEGCIFLKYVQSLWEYVKYIRGILGCDKKLFERLMIPSGELYLNTTQLLAAIYWLLGWIQVILQHIQIHYFHKSAPIVVCIN